MIKRRLFRSAVAIVAISTMMVTPVSATSLEEQKAVAQSDVSSLQSQLTDLMTKINTLEKKLINKGQEIEKAEKDLAVAQEKEKEQYETMKLRIKYMYEDGSLATVEKIITSGTISEMLEQVEYASSIHNYDRNALIEYQNTQTEIADLKTSLETDMTKLEKLEKDFSTQQTELDATLQSKEAQVADLDEQIQAAAEEAAKRAAEEAAAKEAEQDAEKTAQDLTIQTSDDEQENDASEDASNKKADNKQDTSEKKEDTKTETQPATDKKTDTNNDSTNTSTSSKESAKRQKILNAAYSQLGVPYKWGGSTPYKGLDCSGLVQYCYGQAGIYLPHYSESQMAGGRVTTNPKPGDICWKPGHVAIYIGGGQMIEAQQTGTNIMISNVRVRSYITYF